ncbi:MAG: hypothetical protein E7262_00565 [Lachnospiraceae bacterium]|nr:hypothetical protein [Lachnospiraceae bacterium]
MKINDIEEEIVKKFIIKNKQERILWELGSLKKREQVFWRFSGPDILKKECLKFSEYMSIEELEAYLMKFTLDKKVYYIGGTYIGEITIEEALKKIYLGDISIVYCGNGVGYYQGEEDNGHRPRCLLKEV